MSELTDYIASVIAGLQESQREYSLFGQDANIAIFHDDGLPATDDDPNDRITIQVLRLDPYPVNGYASAVLRMIIQRTQASILSAERLLAWAQINLSGEPQNLGLVMVDPDVQEAVQKYAIDWSIVVELDTGAALVHPPEEFDWRTAVVHTNYD